MTNEQNTNTLKMLGRLSQALVARKIVKVAYMDLKSQEKNYDWWSGRPVIITLDNGVEIFPMSDEEGNESGVLNTNVKDAETAWTLDWDDSGEIPTQGESNNLIEYHAKPKPVGLKK